MFCCSIENLSSIIIALLCVCSMTAHGNANHCKMDTSGTKDFILYSEVLLAQGVVVDHTPLTVMTNHESVMEQDYGQ